MKPAAPPRLATWLLDRVRSDYREELVGDLLEDFHRRVEQGSRLRARVALWREAAIAIAYYGIARDKSRVPTRRGDRMGSMFAGDLRLGVRTMRRDPGFLAFAGGTLAIAIGATTAIFSIVNPLIIRSLPYPDPSQLVMLWERGDGGSQALLGYTTFTDLTRDSHTLAASGVIKLWTPVVGGTEPEQVTGGRVSAGYFPTLGVWPAIGRGFSAEDDRPGRNQVILLSDGLWRRAFGADPHVVGRAIMINGLPMTVVGVMPAAFDDVVWPGAEIWQPLGYDLATPMACRTCRHLHMIARVKPGVSEGAALTELNTISARFVAEHPKEYAATGVLVEPLQRAVMHDYQAVLVALAAAVLIVLLIATANVVNLQLARAIRRRAEFAVRVALGAGRAALTRQLLAEGLLLSIVGGVGGVVIGRFVLPVLVRRLPTGIPGASAVHFDSAACAVAACAMLLVGVVVGLMPARESALMAAHDWLRAGGGSGSGRRSARIGLVVGEFALALILLFGAGLIGQSLVRLMAVDVGFDPDHLLTLRLSAVGPAYNANASVYAYHDRVLAAVRAVPGVIDAAIANQFPLNGSLDRYSVQTQDRPSENPELAPNADRYVVTRDFLSTMRIPLVEGRGFESEDFADSAAKVVLVSGTLARARWPSGEAVGKQIRVGGSGTPWRTVIGVVGDVHQASLDAQGPGQFYVPEQQWPWSENDVALVARTTSPPQALAASVRRAVSAVDAAVPISRVQTMQQVTVAAAAQRRLAMLVFAAFATVAVVLAVGGIYGVLAGSIAERRREIGVRSALGAAPGRILAMVMAEGYGLAAAGSAIGFAGAFVVTRFLRPLLFEVQPMDPATLVGVSIVLAAITLLACYVPASRAVRIAPVSALREE